MRLGLQYTSESCEFRVYAPTRNKIQLLIYEDYLTIERKSFTMQKQYDGTFYIKVKGDLKDKYYMYLIEEKYEVTDPYAYASSVNSLRCAIVDLRETDPPGFRNHKIPKNLWKNAIIYELHVKDYSVDISSNTKRIFRGKFLGIADESFYDGLETGIGHLKDLGITHVHLMPVMDFITVDERNETFFDDDNYNWGYDPELYNVIEGSYSTDPTDPKCRMIELKTLIQKLHENGISVVLDVVYNHTYRAQDSNFNMLYPNYYYRIREGNFSNGSGTGNEFCSESAMGRKFILDSLLFLMKEYLVDGFRFDLMALIDRETVMQLVKSLRKINPEVLIYGEPWMADDSPLPLDQRTLVGTQTDFSLFNGEFRDSIRGDNDGFTKGYVQGEEYLKNAVERGICGSIAFDEYHVGFCYEPYESINYFNSHDNLILMDKIKNTAEKKDWIDMNKMCFNIILLSQGIPFFHAGNEFLRDKKGISNSYRSPLAINAIRWEKKKEYLSVFQYVKELISFRKEYSQFTLNSQALIRKDFYFIDKLPNHIIGYTIRKDNMYLFVFHNIGQIYEIAFKNIIDFFGRVREKRTIKMVKEVFCKEGATNAVYEPDTQFTELRRLETKVLEIWLE